MNSDSEIHDVSDTSFWVAYYRAKENERPGALFHDPLAKVLVGERGKKISDAMGPISRYTEWSVISRTVIIDRFIYQLILDGVDAVINLGAGLDTRPYRMQLPENFVWVEADYPNIIAHKNRLLQDERPNCELTRAEVDLANSQERKAFLSRAVPHAKKVLVLTEGVIPYLSPEQVADLGADLASQSRFIYWITEYFDRRVYRYLKNTVRQLKMQNAPFRFYPDDWFGFFKSVGWVEKETRFAGEIATEFKRKVPMPRWAELVMFFLPKHVKETALRMSGYVVLTRR